MPFDIDLSPSLAFMLERLPHRTRGHVSMRLARLAEAAEHWRPGDPRWGQLARSEGRELVVYVEGCCLRLELAPERHRLILREVGRVLVHLPRGEHPTQDVGQFPASGISC